MNCLAVWLAGCRRADLVCVSRGCCRARTQADTTHKHLTSSPTHHNTHVKVYSFYHLRFRCTTFRHLPLPLCTYSPSLSFVIHSFFFHIPLLLFLSVSLPFITSPLLFSSSSPSSSYKHPPLFSFFCLLSPCPFSLFLSLPLLVAPRSSSSPLSSRHAPRSSSLLSPSLSPSELGLLTTGVCGYELISTWHARSEVGRPIHSPCRDSELLVSGRGQSANEKLTACAFRTPR